MSNDDFDILEWIETGTIGRREVTIYANKGLAAEMDRLATEREKVAKLAADEEASMADVSRLEELDAEIADVLAKWEASKSVWTVQALADDVVLEVLAEIPDPKPPVKPREPKDSPTPAKAVERRKEYEAEMAKYEDALKPWRVELDKARTERELRLLSEAVVNVSSPSGKSTSHVSVEALRAMRENPATEHGYKRLSQAANELKTNEVEIAAPHRG